MSRPLHIAISAPTGYNTRELLTPLKGLLTADEAIDRVTVLTPAADHQPAIFPDYGPKFSFLYRTGGQTHYDALLAKLMPDLVVTPTAGLDDKDTPILRASKQAKIRTFTFIASWDNVYKMERFKQYGKPYVLADYFGVWNQMMRDHLLRVLPQIHPERIFIVGAPRLDVFSHTDRIPTKQALYDYLELPDATVPLLHIATTELYPMEYIVKTIHQARLLKQLPEQLYLYASVHPGGSLERHQGYAKRYGVTVRYSFGRRDNAVLPEFIYNPTPAETYLLVALFKHARVLVNHSSTVAIESMLADVPVVNVKYGQRFDWWRWRRSMVFRDFQQHYDDIVRGGGTTVAHSPRELVASIQRYLLHPEYKRAERAATTARMITFADGTASQRLLDTIKQVALR